MGSQDITCSFCRLSLLRATSCWSLVLYSCSWVLYFCACWCSSRRLLTCVSDYIIEPQKSAIPTNFLHSLKETQAPMPQRLANVMCSRMLHELIVQLCCQRQGQLYLQLCIGGPMLLRRKKQVAKCRASSDFRLTCEAYSAICCLALVCSSCSFCMKAADSASLPLPVSTASCNF